MKQNRSTSTAEEKEFQHISTNELNKMIENPRVQIIDVRSAGAYNGWREQNEPRGGHISGARSLPAKWAEYIDWIEIVRSKDISPDNSLVIYGYDTENILQVARLFQRAGYKDVSLYEHFTDEWSAQEEYPMDQLARYRHLVSAPWLKQLLDKASAPEYENDTYVVCHAHYRNYDDYKKGHIPGAIALDTNSLESTETWNRRSPAELKAALEEHGITSDTTVILYGRFSFPDNDDPFPGSSAGHRGAFRCAMIMLYAGVEDVRMLNGGLQSWQDEGYEVTTEETKPEPVRDFGEEIPAHPEYIVDLPEAEEMLASDDKNLVSVRSWREFIGEVSGYNYIEEKGRIPGAVFADCGSDAYHMENYRNLDHTVREYHEVEQEWAGAGITPDKHNAFYCGTGWRGSEAFFNAWFMGWPRVSVFDGGWFEWVNSGKAYETGHPEEVEIEG